MILILPLVRGEVPTDALADDFKTPNGHRITAKTLVLHNSTISPINYNLRVVPSGEVASESQWVCKNFVVDAGKFLTMELQLALAGGDSLQTQASADGLFHYLSGISTDQ